MEEKINFKIVESKIISNSEEKINKKFDEIMESLENLDNFLENKISCYSKAKNDEDFLKNVGRYEKYYSPDKLYKNNKSFNIIKKE